MGSFGGFHHGMGAFRPGMSAFHHGGFGFHRRFADRDDFFHRRFADRDDFRFHRRFFIRDHFRFHRRFFDRNVFFVGLGATYPDYDYGCWVYRPVYRYGIYVGQRLVNICY
jgi:hypothetical protein